MTTASDTVETRRLRHALVDELIRAGDLTDEQWIRAFRAVPRHCFVPRYYPDPRSSVDSSDPGWLPAVYSDSTLITQRRPDAVTSSGTMPGLIATMLRALDVHDGHTVLQAGTGSGYTAALLCEILGSSRVVTMDVDPELTGAGHERLRACGYDPDVVTADAARGWTPRAPYDRVMATFAVRTVPTAWLEQTRDGGVIVAPVRSALARLTVHGGTGQGMFLENGAYFMRHRPTPHAPPLARHDPADGPAWPHRKPRLPGSVVWDNAARFALDVLVPDLVIGHGPGGLHDVVLSTPDGSHTRHAPGGELHQTGPRALWDEVEAAHDRWQAWDRPGRERFGLTAAAAGGQRVWLDHPGQPVAELTAGPETPSPREPRPNKHER